MQTSLYRKSFFRVSTGKTEAKELQHNIQRIVCMNMNSNILRMTVEASTKPQYSLMKYTPYDPENPKWSSF